MDIGIKLMCPSADFEYCLLVIQQFGRRRGLGTAASLDSRPEGAEDPHNTFPSYTLASSATTTRRR